MLELLNLYLFPEKERKDETQASLSSPYREIEQLRPFTVIESESENERRETKDELSDGTGREAPSPEPDGTLEQGQAIFILLNLHLLSLLNRNQQGKTKP